MTSSYATEFPDFGAMDIGIPDGFVDVSWKNDQCPCFASVDHMAFLFVDYADAHKREFTESPRLTLHEGEVGKDGDLQHPLDAKILGQAETMSELAQVIDARFQAVKAGSAPSI